MLKLVRKNFSLDLRSLALFRVFVAIILLVDFLFTRLPFFDLFYTDKGLLPIKKLLGSGSFWASTSSLNFVSSSSFYQAWLFVLALVFFFMLLIGYKTRLALFGSWILLASFQSRNFLILNSGDVLFLLMLFWALRLPLAEYFAIDSVLKKGERKKQIFSFNSLAFIFQILFVYYFTYLLKTDPIWKTGQGVYYALMLDNFRTVWGDILLQYPKLMKILSIVTYYIIESLLPLAFIFFGFLWRFRTLLILIMCGFHLSLGLFLHLGLFSWICIAGWLVFLPSQVWDTLSKWFSRNQSPLTVYYDGACVFCEKTVFLMKEFFILSPKVSFKPAKSNEKAFLEMEKKQSWLFWNKQTGWHDRWLVFVKLISYSPLLFWIAPLLKGHKCSKWGNKFYGIVAQNRQSLGSYLKFLKAPVASLDTSASSISPQKTESFFSISKGVFFFFCFIYVIMWNVRTLDFNYYSRFMPKSWNSFGAFFHLHQYWNMFAPKPLDTTGWVILLAKPVTKTEQPVTKTKPVTKAEQPVTKAKPITKTKTKTKTKTITKAEPVAKEVAKQTNTYLLSKEEGLIDLWQGGAPLSYQKPIRYDMTFPVFRIRKMLENLVLKHKRESRNYLAWLCRKWNKKERRIKKIELIYMKQKVTPYGQPLLEAKKTHISRKICP